MFWGLTREQVSRVAPVWHTSPIFVAIMAVFFLGESLGWAQWLAIALVVFGAIAISMRSSDLGIGFGIRPTFLVILLGAFLIGMGQLLLKEGSADQSIWSLMAFRGLGLFTAMFVPFARPRSFVTLARYMRSPLRAGAITLNDAVAPFVGNLLLLWAIAVGPISLVSGVVASRPVFVLAITVGIGLLAKRLLPDEGDDAVGRGPQGDGDGGGRSGSSDNRRCVSRDSNCPMSLLAYKTTEPSPAT